MTRTEQMRLIAADLTDLANNLKSAQDTILVDYERVTEETLSRYSEWTRQRLGLLTGEEVFLIRLGGDLLYSVNVTGDSALTAAEELLRKLAAKF